VRSHAGATAAFRRLAAAIALTAAVSCSGIDPGGDGTRSVIRGVVVEISSAGLDQINTFTVKSGDRSYRITVDESTDFAFNPSHLYQHRTTGEPVQVRVDRKGGSLVALSVDDA
jgi:hypothetical protein